jgi:hypothetical protein
MHMLQLECKKVGNLALKAKVVEHEETHQGHGETSVMMCPEDVRYEYDDHMAFAARSFWVDPFKSKEKNYQRNKSSEYQINDSIGQRVRTCYNCNDQFHFVAGCPYEK